MLQFRRHELPLAYTLVLTAKRIRPRRDGRHPFEQYFLVWTAFNNIYTTIAARRGLKTSLQRDQTGQILTVTNGSLRIPLVQTPSESQQIRQALVEFSPDLKHDLVSHPGTAFFAQRIPFWGGVQIEVDGFGQRVNGVIDVAATTDPSYPVWSPVDTPAYQAYLADPVPGENLDFLAGQVVDLLHTIRRNFAYGGSVMDDSLDVQVVQHGFPMLEIIVSAFLR